jgi:intracellular septation protein
MSAVFLGSHFVGDRVLLERAAHTAMTLPPPVWRRLNVAWALFFAFCAILNLYVAHNYAEATWVKFKLIAFTALPFVFALAQAPFLMRYLEQPSEQNE